MRNVLLFTAVFVLILLGVDCLAGWGNGICAPVGAPASVTYQWVRGEQKDQIHLFWGRQQVGTFCFSDGEYYPYDGNTWGNPSTPPVGSPPVPEVVGKKIEEFIFTERVVPPSESIPQQRNFGVYWRPDDSRGEEISYTNKEGTLKITPKAASVLVGGSLQDDSNFLRLTILDPDPIRRKKISEELGKLPEFRNVLIQAYHPDHWAVKEAGFRASSGAATTIYIQSPPRDGDGAGVVLHRQPDYNDGSAGVIKAIRKMDPNYSPDKDPDLRKDPPVVSVGWITEHLMWVISGILCFLTWAFTPDFRRIFA
jgi:hypothetical protein